MGTESESGTPSRTYGGVSADERSALRRAALLEAALDLLAEGGADAVTKRAVCARARLNDRYFYEHFADRDALLRILVEDLTSQGIAAAVTGALTTGPDLRARFRGGVDAAFAFLAKDPRRNAFFEASHHSDAIYRARVSTQHAIAKAMVAVRRDMIGEVDLDPSDTEISAYILASGTLELVAAWNRGEFDGSREHMVDLVTRMLLGSSNRVP